MASNSQGPTGGQPGPSVARKEFKVRINRDRSMMKHHVVRMNGAPVDFTTADQITLQRENNLRAFKSAHNIDQMPKFGAGSEYGRDQKNEARRKKFGYATKNYNSEDQPWHMKLKVNGNEKKYKGVKGGGVSDNTSYFVFVQAKDGFDAIPVDSWYNFTPTVTYKYLNSDEAEAEFTRRDKNLNLFSVMVRHRVKPEADLDEEDNKESVKAALKKRGKGFILKETDDWADMSDEEDPLQDGADDEDMPRKKGKGKGKTLKKKLKEEERDIHEEAVEDSDDGDVEGYAVDYMSDTSASDSNDDERETKVKYEMKGVEDEDALRDVVVSDDDDEEEDKNVKKDIKVEKDEAEDKARSSDSSTSEDESDDPDEAANNFAKVYLTKDQPKKSSRPSTPRPSTPRPVTPKLEPKDEEDSPKGSKKRKYESSPSNLLKTAAGNSKKLRTGSPSVAADNSSTSSASTSWNPSSSSGSRDTVSEESVKRYLLRKPMTTMDLLAKFRSKRTGLAGNELVVAVGNILKRMRPQLKQFKVNENAYWSLK